MLEPQSTLLFALLIAIFGALVTLAVQHQWRRWNSSNPTSASASGASSKTVA